MPSKRSPFTHQKESFYTPKRALLHTKRSPFEMPSDFALRTTVPMALCIRVCTDFIISIFFEILKSGNVVYMVIFPYFCIIMRGWTHSVLYDTAKTLTH